MLCDGGEAARGKGFKRNHLVAEKGSQVGDHAVCKAVYVLCGMIHFPFAIFSHCQLPLSSCQPHSHFCNIAHQYKVQLLFEKDSMTLWKIV